MTKRNVPEPAVIPRRGRKASIPPNLHAQVLEKAGEGISLQRISEWLRAEHGVKTTAVSVHRLMERIRKEREPIAQAVVREKLAGTLTADLDAVEGILKRAERDEEAVGKLADVEKEVERIAKVDILNAYAKDGTLKPLDEMDEDTRRAIAGVEVEEMFEGVGEERVKVGDLVKVKFWDKPRTLEMLGKMRASLAKREMALKARDQQLRALTLRFELSGASGRGSGDDAADVRARLLAKLDAESATG